MQWKSDETQLKTMDHQWEGTFLLSHESFGGYTHKDGSVTLYVVATDEEEAKRKP